MIVFELINPNFLFEHKKSLEYAFAQQCVAIPTSVKFDVDKESGFIKFHNDLPLKDVLNLKGLYPKTSSEAIEKSLKFYVKLQKEINILLNNWSVNYNSLYYRELESNKSFFKPIKNIDFLPNADDFANSVAIPLIDQTTEAIIGWKCKFSPTINLNGKLVPVFGSSIEIRIGQYDAKNAVQIISVEVNWRTIVRYSKVERFLQTNSEPEHKHGSQHAHLESKEKPIVYFLYDDKMPQIYLSPYEINIVSGHHVDFFPASNYSLYLEFLVERQNNGINIKALVFGGSGSYEGNWHIIPMSIGVKTSTKNAIIKTQIIQGRHLSLTELNVEVEGQFNLALHINDLKTKAVFSKCIFIIGKKQSNVFKLKSNGIVA